jgi:ABC-type multidrug transport system fused ATPase/permease subunit
MDIRFEQVGFTYQPHSPFEQRVLFDIDLEIKEGSYTALVGHTVAAALECIIKTNDWHGDDR